MGDESSTIFRNHGDRGRSDDDHVRERRRARQCAGWAPIRYVSQPLNVSATEATPSNAQSLQGTVQRIGRNAGSFTIDAGGGAQLLIALPYKANSADVNRFNNTQGDGG